MIVFSYKICKQISSKSNQAKPSQAKKSNLCLVLVASSKEEGRNPHRYSWNPEPLMTVD
jgi:hypothetical protein